MFTFTKNEIRDLIIAFIVITIAFAISTVGLDLYGFISILPIIMIGVGIGFLLHELGHRYVAIKYGYRAEFKAWPLGLVVALASAFTGFVFAVPGSSQVYADNISDEINGKISVAGPMANMALSIIFIVVAALIYPFASNSIIELIFLICTVGFSVNNFLAAFNLLPFYSLDGTKVLKWDVKIWSIIFAISVLMLVASITIGPEKLVKLLI